MSSSSTTLAQLSDETGGYILLARELQNSLYLIARHAEMNSSDSQDRISHIAEASLSLIDSYLMAAQVERGQMRLELEPVSIGSVLHDAKYELLRMLPASQPIDIIADVDKPVMTHRAGLQAAIVSSGLTLAETASKASKPLILRGYRTRAGLSGVGVFVSDMKLTNAELARAVNTIGSSKMSLPRHLSGSGVALSVAHALYESIGGKLHVKHLGRQCGLSTILPSSEQLAIL